MADREVTDTTQAGIWITANRNRNCPRAMITGNFAAVVESNSHYFTVDMMGNVRGDPAAVEREALSLGVHENLIAKAAVGLARLAMRSMGQNEYGGSGYITRGVNVEIDASTMEVTKTPLKFQK